MDLNLFENLKKDIKSNVDVNNFMDELSNFLNNITLSKTTNSQTGIRKEEIDTNISETSQNKESKLTKKNIDLEKNRKEGHLYLVTEDRNNEIYLWDFTDKPKHEFVEKNLSEDLLKIATEGAMLQYRNGSYELYSPNGYDMLYNDENNKNINK